METRETDINLDSSYIKPIINVSQYDHDTGTLIFNLYNGADVFEIPDDAMILVTGSKPDKEVFVYAADSYSENRVVASLYNHMTSAAGDVTCELRIYQGGNAVGTANFTLHVEKAAVTDELVTSESALNGLNAAIEALTEIDEKSTAAGNSADAAKAWAVGPSAEETAGTDTDNAKYWAGQAKSYAIGFTDKGDYSADSTYVTNDLVHYQNSIWRCILDDTTGITPAEGTNWTAFISTPSEAKNISYDSTSSGLSSANLQDAVDELNHKVTGATYTVSSTGWTASDSQYVYSIAVTSVYADVPDVYQVPTSGTSLTTDEITAYGLIQSATIDPDTNTLRLYAASQPTADFAIYVKGVE